MSPQVKIGVAAFIQKVSGGPVLVGCRRGSHGAGTWTVPGGGLEFGETIEECARREIKEETGLDVLKVSMPFAVTDDMYLDDGKHYVTVWVEATVADDAVPVNVEPHKCDGWEWHMARAIPEPHFPGLGRLMALRPAYFTYLE